MLTLGRMDTLQALSFFSIISSCFLSSSNSPLVFLTGCWWAAGLRPPITLSCCTGWGAILRHTAQLLSAPPCFLLDWAMTMTGPAAGRVKQT